MTRTPRDDRRQLATMAIMKSIAPNVSADFLVVCAEQMLTVDQFKCALMQWQDALIRARDEQIRANNQAIRALRARVAELPAPAAEAAELAEGESPEEAFTPHDALVAQAKAAWESNQGGVRAEFSSEKAFIGYLKVQSRNGVKQWRGE